jgi:hypothetical protein
MRLRLITKIRRICTCVQKPLVPNVIGTHAKTRLGWTSMGFLKSSVDHDQPKRIDYWAWTSAGYSADWPNKAKISVQAWAKHQIDSLS